MSIFQKVFSKASLLIPLVTVTSLSYLSHTRLNNKIKELEERLVSKAEDLIVKEVEKKLDETLETKIKSIFHNKK
jgi:hypothetical protein